MPTIKKPNKRKRDNSRKKHGLQAKIQRLIYNTSHWRKLVAAKKMMSPLCERCLSEGRTTATQEIHHIIPLKTCNGDLNYLLQLAFDYDNLMSVCCQCHEDIHAEMRAKHKRKFTP